MKNKKLIAMIAACGLIAMMGVGGTVAYLTDQTNATNTFTFGDVKVNTVETAWDSTDEDGNGVPDAAESVVPNQQVPKSVQAENVGINDAIVFVKITVPVETVTLVSDDGTVQKKADGSHDKKPQEIFYFQQDGDSINTEDNNFDAAWVNLPEEETGYDGAGGKDTYLSVNTVSRSYTENYRTYVFGYNKRLAKGELTTTLFDKVQIKNIIENEIASTGTKDIKVETYSIQADNIVNSKGAINTDGVIDHDTLKEIYDIYVMQNPETKNVKSQAADTEPSAKESQTETKNVKSQAADTESSAEESQTETE